MWGIFVGIGLGAFQYWLLRKTTEWITSDKKKGVLMAVPVILAKLLVILGTLFLLAWFDRTFVTMIWAAGGLLATMITLSIITNRRQVKKQKEQEDDKQ